MAPWDVKWHVLLVKPQHVVLISLRVPSNPRLRRPHAGCGAAALCRFAAVAAQLFNGVASPHKYATRVCCSSLQLSRLRPSRRRYAAPYKPRRRKYVGAFLELYVQRFCVLHSWFSICAKQSSALLKRSITTLTYCYGPRRL